MLSWPVRPTDAPFGPTDDREAVRREIESGLRHERANMAAIEEDLDFYQYESERWVPRRESETEFDYAGRPKRQCGFLRQAIDALCRHAYCPGPRRTFSEGAEWLDAELSANHVDALMQSAEVGSTIGGLAALEVRATGDPERPLDFSVWWPNEIVVFPDARDWRKPFAVVTVDRWNERTRYRCWYPDAVETYLTDDVGPGKPRPGALARFAGSEPNAYGVAPFAFLHYAMPARCFGTPGIGRFLRRAEARMNDRLSQIDALETRYLEPTAVFKNVDPTFNPVIGNGRFIRLTRPSGIYAGDGLGPQGDPSAEYLQPHLEIEQVWGDLKGFREAVAEAVDLPAAALTLDYADAPSGISLIVRQAPLLARALRRRPLYQKAEDELARVCLRVTGAFYDRPELVALAARREAVVVCSWPEPRIPVPGPDRDAADDWEIQRGLKSLIMVVEERYGLSRDQAIEHLRRVAEDREALSQFQPQDDGQGDGMEEQEQGQEETDV